MRRAIHTRPLSINLSDEDYDRVKKITDEQEILVDGVISEKGLCVNEFLMEQ